MSAAIRGPDNGTVGSHGYRVLVVDREYFEEVFGSAAVLLGPSLTTVIGMKDSTFFADDPSAFAIGGKANGIEVAVLEQRGAVALLEGLFNPGLAMVR